MRNMTPYHPNDTIPNHTYTNDTSQDTNAFVDLIKSQIKDADNDVKDGRKRVSAAKAPASKKKGKAQAEAVSSAEESD